MTSYYNRVTGNLYPGDVAKAEDIHDIQTNIQDMSKNMISDHHERNSYILGGRENDFLLTPARKTLGRYLDTYSVPTEGNLIALPLREYRYKQPIAKTKSSIYSFVCKMGNRTNHNVPVTCSLYDENGVVLRSDTVTLKANTDKVEYEFLFDYNHATTAFGLDMEKLVQEDGRHIPSRTKETAYKEGPDVRGKQDPHNYSAGVTQLYVVIEEIGIQSYENFIEELKSDSFVIYADKNGEYGAQFDSYVEQGQQSAFQKTAYSLYFKDVYATDLNYSCTGGEAIIGGEKVICMDSYVTISGAHEYGNVLSLIYMDMKGKLHSANSKASINNTSTDIQDWAMEDILPPEYLLIAKVLVYSDINKEPLIIQDDTNQETRPRSHHERLRRIEKRLGYHEDIAIPPRLKYTVTGDDWVDTEGDNSLLAAMYESGSKENDADKVNYYLTMDAEGHLVVKSTESEVTTANVTLMNDEKTADTSRIIPTELQTDEEKTVTTTETTGTSSGSKKFTKEQVEDMFNQIKNGTKSIAEIANEYKTTESEIKEVTNTSTTTTTKEIITKTAIDTNITAEQTEAIFKSYEPDDLRRLNRIAEMTNINLESKTGTITLKNKSAAKESSLATTDEEAKETKFNPWDDDASNRPANKEVEPTSRQYTVVSGKNGENDFESEFPAMTFYTSSKYNLTGLTIPIIKFENCSGIKFYIWKRQGPNNKTNTVWFEKRIYTSKTFSLDNARTDDKYQYMDDGFTINFEDGGLDLPEGQYVIVCVPVPKSGQGSCWVDTYKPENSKDFCIRYYGAANASHFLLKDRYQEIWYNPATATGSKSSYEKEGSFISGTITLKEDMPPISKIRTSIGKNEIPKGCSIEVYGDTGAGFQKLNTDSESIDTTEGNETTMKGNRTSFKWKVVLKGDEENTPTLEYDEEKKYAIQFTIIHEAPNIGNSGQAFAMDKNMCITSKPFDGDSILREYLGDMNFDRDDNRFSNFEFARVWAKKQNNPNLVIDISGSDLTETIKDKNNVSHQYSAYSLHYVDLTLNDFNNTSVDYSNYDNAVEIDENNMRLKLDTNNSYNDNDIQLFNMNDFEEIIDDSNVLRFNDGVCTIPNNYNPQENKLLYRLRFKNPVDLTKYTGIKVGFKLPKGTAESSLKGLGVYLSASYQDDVPSNVKDEFDNVVVISGINAFLKEFGKTTNYETLVNKYKDKIIKVIEQPEGLKGTTTTYYRYIPRANALTDDSSDLVYGLSMLHDVKDYALYEFGTIKPDTKEEKIVYQEIEIDQESTNLKYVQEIGVILIGDELDENENNKLSVVNNISLSLHEFKSIEHDYYPVFNPSDNHEMILYDPTFTTMTNPYTIRKNGDIDITATTYGGTLGISGTVPKSFKPAVEQIHIDPLNINGAGQTLCYFPNKFATKQYKHIGIQIAADVYLPKYSLRLNLCKDSYGKDVVDYVDLPTLNYIWAPNNTGTINLTQVFKKINELSTPIRSLSISTTEKFKTYAKNIVGTGENRKKYINVFIGKIVMYKAETIPMFHKKMRFKFYDKNNDGTNDHKDIMIRKIGAVLDYR